MNNIYWNPEEFGLTIVGESVTSEGWYSLRTVVFQDESGDFLYGESTEDSYHDIFLDQTKENLKKVQGWEHLKAVTFEFHECMWDENKERLKRCIESNFENLRPLIIKDE